ncbi:MAG: HigA family addiction module antidote protein [Gammaproteobacteria bacterium]|nr:HigA family addiction module antidote protein [Gammaproteobacteria bacterium]
MAAQKPAQVFPPGEILKDELEERGWSQAEFAEILGRPAGLVTDIITGRRGITPETAALFGEAFDVPAEFWMNLEAMYQLSRVPQSDDGAVVAGELEAG